MPDLASSSRLKELVAGSSADVSHDLRVILVPDCASGPFAERLSSSQWHWLENLSQRDRCRAQFYEFQYRWQQSVDKSAWAQCFDSGDSLYSMLLQLEQTQIKPVPFAFIGNGIGGLVLKKTIARLKGGLLDPIAKSIWNKMSLLAFIGCPHAVDRSEWDQLGPVLRHDRGLRKIDPAYKRAVSDQGTAASICRKFQEAGMICTILTTYESSTAEVRLKELITPQGLARTYMKQEEYIRLNVPDRQLRRLNADNPDFTHFCTRLAAGFVQCHTMYAEAEEDELSSLETSMCDDGTGNIFASISSLKRLASVQDYELTPQSSAFVSSPEEMSSPIPPWVASQYRAPSLPRYCYGGHTKNTNFVGRQDVLEKIDAALLPEQSTGRSFGSAELKSFALCGLGGLGKTQIALHYAFSRQGHFDAIFWLQADSKTGLDNSFADAVAQLGLSPTSDLGDLAESFTMILRWLQNPTKRPRVRGSADSPQMSDAATWLLVYDNVSSFELLSRYWPTGASGSVLITSRKADGINFCHGRGLDLKPMGTSDARELMLRVLARRSHDREPDDKDVSFLLKKASGVPLAIVRFASLISAGRMTLDELLSQWEVHIRQYQLREPQLTQDDVRYSHSLFTVWELDTLKPQTQGLLNVMSLLHPFQIQEDVLKSFICVEPSTTYPINEEAYLLSRKELLDVSLVSRDTETKSLALHPLVQDILQARMYPNNFSPSFTIAVRLLQAAWPNETQKLSHESNHLHRAKGLIDHAQSLISAYLKYESLRKGHEDFLQAWVELLIKSSWYLYQRSEYETAQSYIQLARDLAESSKYTALKADVLMTQLVVGVHTTPAEELLADAERHQFLREEIFETNSRRATIQMHTDLAMGLSVLAGVQNHCGLFDKALDSAERSLKIYHSSDEYKDGRKVAMIPIQHQCWALWSMGRHMEAQNILAKTLEDIRPRKDGRTFRYWRAGLYMILGNVQESLGNIQESSGNAQAAMEKFAESEASHRMALELYHRYNGDGIRTAIAHHKLASHAARNKDEASAISAWNDYEIAIRLFDQNRYYIQEGIRARISAARFLRSRNRNPQVADDLMEGAAKSLRILELEGDPETLTDDQLSAMVKLRSR